MRVAVNHLTFAEPIPDTLIASAQDAARAVEEAGGECRLVQVDETHAFLVPLLASPPERTSGDLVAG